MAKQQRARIPSLSLGVIYEYFTAPQSRKRNRPRIFALCLPWILASSLVYAPGGRRRRDSRVMNVPSTRWFAKPFEGETQYVVVPFTSTVIDRILNSLTAGRRILWKVLVRPCPFIRLSIMSITTRDPGYTGTFSRFAAGEGFADLNIKRLKHRRGKTEISHWIGIHWCTVSERTAEYIAPSDSNILLCTCTCIYFYYLSFAKL